VSRGIGSLSPLLREACLALLVVTEMLPGPEELWVRDAAGSYATELLVQMEGAERPASAERRAIVATGCRA